MKRVRTPISLVALTLSSCTVAAPHLYLGRIERTEIGSYSGHVYSPNAPTAEVVPAKVYIRVEGVGTICVVFPDSEPNQRTGRPGDDVVFSLSGPLSPSREIPSSRITRYQVSAP